MANITFIGLGNIGYFAAGNLAKAGHSVTAYNRTKAKAEDWANEYPGTAAESIPAAIRDAEVIFTCVSDDEAMEDVYFSEQGILAHAPAGALIVDHSTVSVTISQRIAEEAQNNKNQFFDAPVSGGSIGAQNGTLAVMVGGPIAAYPQLEALAADYTSSIKLIGPSGSGQLTKMVNQICTSANISAVAEGMALANAAGLDQSTVVEAIKSGAAGSWMLENRSDFMIKDSYEPGFEANLMLKDVKLALDHAQSIGLDVPQLELAVKRYQKLVDSGHGSEDMSAIYRLVSE